MVERVAEFDLKRLIRLSTDPTDRYNLNLHEHQTFEPISDKDSPNSASKPDVLAPLPSPATPACHEPPQLMALSLLFQLMLLQENLLPHHHTKDEQSLECLDMFAMFSCLSLFFPSFPSFLLLAIRDQHPGQDAAYWSFQRIYLAQIRRLLNATKIFFHFLWHYFSPWCLCG